MDWNTAHQVVEGLARDTAGDAMLTDLYRDLLWAAVRYARIRAEWTLWDVDERRRMDSSRRIAHDSLIDACNILARNLEAKGRSAAWRDQLGDDRIRIGDFACYVIALVGLKGR